MSNRKLYYEILNNHFESKIDLFKSVELHFKTQKQKSKAIHDLLKIMYEEKVTKATLLKLAVEAIKIYGVKALTLDEKNPTNSMPIFLVVSDVVATHIQKFDEELQKQIQN